MWVLMAADNGAFVVPTCEPLRQPAAIAAPSDGAIPRRDFFLGVVATLLGSSCIVAWNNSIAKSEKDAAIKRLRASKDKQITDINNINELSIKKAQSDKYIAIQEVADQRADKGLYANTDTVGFSELKKEFPWLESLRKTVSFLEFGDNFGSAVLLDKYGTIALCAHELPNSKKESTRLFFNTKENGETIEVKPHDFLYDTGHDLMLATIDSALIQKYGLQPVRWGRMGYDNSVKQTGKAVISVGWAMPSFRLHATMGVTTGASLTDLYHTKTGDITQLQCKIKSNGVTFAGMSGGGVFQDQKFVGIVNASSAPGSDASTDFTPVDLIRETYIGLYPDRARRMGIKKIDNANTPADCRFNRSEFLSRSVSRHLY
jgi:hypothetical protein